MAANVALIMLTGDPDYAEELHRELTSATWSGQLRICRHLPGVDTPQDKVVCDKAVPGPERTWGFV